MRLSSNTTSRTSASVSLRFIFSRFILCILLLFVCRSPAAQIVYKGYVPAGLDTVQLHHEYTRIGRTVGLTTVRDTAPVIILFYRISEERKIGIRLPEWGGGGALGVDSIVIPVDRRSAFYPQDMQRILLHEMVHIALARAYGRLRIPRWFHEGVAMTLSGDISFEQQVELSKAILFQALVPLDSMEQMNRFGRWRASVAYSQCHFAVNFLVTTYGLDMLPELLAESQRTRRFDTACVNVFGLTVRELEVLLDQRLKAQYRMFFIIGDYGMVWGGIFLLSVIAFIATRIRRRSRLKKMAMEEKAGELAIVEEDESGMDA